ncbi:MAG: hypothetical protein AB2A00_17305 [Myxococcota bacterium]
MEGIRLACARLAQGALAWRTGQERSPGVVAARDELPADALRAVEAVARGDTPLSDGAVVAAARRALAFLRVAPELDELCARWQGARAEVGEAVLPAEEARRLALRDGVPARATQLWKGAHEELRSTVDDELSPLCEKLHRPLGRFLRADGAQDFLAATRDLWHDALHHAERYAGGLKDIPGTLRHARILHAPALATMLPVDASRQIARTLVQRLFPDGGALRRVGVEPLPWLGAFATVGERGTPRVGWEPAAGVVAMAELARVTVEACALSLQGVRMDPAVARKVALMMTLGLVGPPVLRKALGLGRADADRLRRQTGTWLLREARVAAALALANPAVPDAAMDAMAEATGGDPDVVEVAATLSPWPAPLIALGPVGLEHGVRWEGWLHAGGLARAARDAWDEDYAVRDVTQDTLRHALSSATAEETDALALLTEELGKLAEDARPLAGFFEEYLG